MPVEAAESRCDGLHRPDRLPRIHGFPMRSTAERQIENLIYQYARHMDRGDFSAVAELFSIATYRSANGATFTGVAELKKVLESVVKLYQGLPHTLHTTTNVEIRRNSGKAEADAYFTVYQQLDDFPLQVIVAGRYEDRFVRRAGKWRFVDRLVSMELFGDLSRHLNFDPRTGEPMT